MIPTLYNTIHLGFFPMIVSGIGEEEEEEYMNGWRIGTLPFKDRFVSLVSCTTMANS